MGCLWLPWYLQIISANVYLHRPQPCIAQLQRPQQLHLGSIVSHQSQSTGYPVKDLWVSERRHLTLPGNNLSIGRAAVVLVGLWH
jgi:hypothetical protein